VLSGARKAAEAQDMYLTCLRGQSTLVAVFALYSPSVENMETVRTLLELVNQAHDSASGDTSALEALVTEAVAPFLPMQATPSLQEVLVTT